METLFWLLVMPLPLADRIWDPAPGIWRNTEEARNLDCARLPQARAHELYPIQVPEPAPRTGQGSLMTIDALVCTQRLMRYGERANRDEVILSSLSRTVGEITGVAASQGSTETRWHVEAFYPEQRMASKIAVAARTDLAERGHKVSDKVPLLAAGDLAVLRGLTVRDAYPIACKRYFDQQILGANDGFLGIVLVDPRETQLHAGICLNGQWRWLQ